MARKAAIAVWVASLASLTAPVSAAPRSGAPAPAAQARGVDDPHDFVARTYEAYGRDPDAPPAEPSFAYSDRLRALFDAYEAWARRHDDLVGSLDFDWWMNAQDWEPVMAGLTEEDDGPDRRTIVARFTSFERPTVNRFRFVRVDGRWYLDDVVNGSGGGDDGWTLSALLQERPE